MNDRKSEAYLDINEGFSGEGMGVISDEIPDVISNGFTGAITNSETRGM